MAKKQVAQVVDDGETPGLPARPRIWHLAELRKQALDAHSALKKQARNVHYDIEQTISDLENWRNEIDATIGFLKAMRR